MVVRKVASSLVNKNTFSSVAVNVLPKEISANNLEEGISFNDDKITKPYSEVPGPKGLPFIGNSWRFAPLIGQYKIQDLDKVMIELQRDFGKVAKVSGLIGHPDLLFIFDGDEIRRVFRREEVLPHRPSMPSLHHYKSVLQKDFFGDNAGVIGVHGKKWDEFRAQVQHILLQPTIAKKYVSPLNDIATEFLDKVHAMRDGNNELPGDFLHELYKWALESIGRVALDTRLGCVDKNENPEAKQIIDAINTFFTTVASVELELPIWRVYKTKSYKRYIGALDSFKDLCLKHINIAMENLKNKPQNRNEEDISLVERILQKTNNPKIAAVLAMDLLFVGVDTTSVAATSTIYQLSQNPDKQERLFQELKMNLPEKNAPFTLQNLDNLPYLKACIKETLRMYPVVIGNGRCLQSDAVVHGYHVPKGTHVIFPHLVVSNLSEYFPEPEKFIPERWIKRGEIADTASCPHAAQKIHPFVSLPFGYGRRMCLGRRFAEAELQILLSKLFRKYQIEYNYGKLTYKVNPTYIPVEPLKFKLTERNE